MVHRAGCASQPPLLIFCMLLAGLSLVYKYSFSGWYSQGKTGNSALAIKSWKLLSEWLQNCKPEVTLVQTQLPSKSWLSMREKNMEQKSIFCTTQKTQIYSQDLWRTKLKTQEVCDVV